MTEIHPRHRARAVAAALVSAIAWLTAIAAVVLIAAAAFQFTGTVRYVQIETPSMTPVMPQGSTVIERSVPTTDIKPGDIVTLSDPRITVPVTHRVVSVKPTDTGASIVLKGDANPEADPDAYATGSATWKVLPVPAWLSRGLLGAFTSWLSIPHLIAVGILAVIAFIAADRLDSRSPAGVRATQAAQSAAN